MKVNLLSKFFCKFFDHKFGEWEYVADDSCEQVRVCRRDGYKEMRKVPHQFSEWEYVADDSCEQVRVCRRDGYKETRDEVLHQFSEWEYVADDSCEQVRVCRRDGRKEEKKEHDWSSETFLNEIEGYAGHKDGYYDVDVEITSYTCKRCGEKGVEVGEEVGPRRWKTVPDEVNVRY